MSRVRRLPLGLALAVVAALLVAMGASASDGGQKIVVRVERGGFRWSDAGVGMLAGIGMTLAAAGCLALVRLRGAGTNSRREGE